MNEKRHPLIIGGVGLMAALILTACTAAADVGPTPTLFTLPTAAATAIPPTEVAVQAPQPTAVAQGEEPDAATSMPTLVPGRPTAPAAVDEYFRPDLAMHVAATGKPQILEFFTYW